MSDLAINTYLANGGASDEDYNNFWDWFCRTSALENRGLALDKKVKRLVDLGVLDGETMSVSYKNNCPMNGRTYDSILVKSLTDNKDLFWIVPASGHEIIKGQAEFYSYETGKEVTFSSWGEMTKAIKTNGINAVIVA